MIKRRSIRLNADATQAKHVQFDGRDHLVVPVVAIVEGVLNGELVPADEICIFPDAWNGIPLMIDHPRANGEPISANDPLLLEKMSPGRFFGANCQHGNSLHGEIWLDVLKVQALAGDAIVAMERLEAGTPLEVSTGYMCKLEEKAGTFNGKAYTGIQREIRPDHLALLVNALGACNWSDGCGAPRVNEHKHENCHCGGKCAACKGEPMKSENSIKVNGAKLGATLTKMVADQVTAERTSEAILDQAAAAANCSKDKLVEVMNGQIDFPPRNWLYAFALVLDQDYYELISAADADASAFRRSITPEFYSNAANGKPSIKQRIGDFFESLFASDTAPASANNSETEVKPTMKDKKTLVDALVANTQTHWTEADRPVLEAFTEANLEKMLPKEAAPAPVVNKEEPKPAVAPAAAPAAVVNAKTIEEEIAEVKNPALKQLLTNSLKRESDERTELIAEIVGNKDAGWTEAELKELPIPSLEKIADSLVTANYSGKGGPRVPRANAADDGDSVPTPPAIVLNEAKENGGKS